MMAKASDRARTVHLPSGEQVRVTVRRDGPRPKPPAAKQRALFDDVRALFREGALIVERASTKARLDEPGVESLPLADFHVLRDYAIRSGLVAASPEELTCDNCDAPIVFDNAKLPPEDLERRYEGERHETERLVRLPEAVRIDARRSADAVKMRAVTVGEAAPLFRELARGHGLRITPKLVRAMGIVRLEGGAVVEDARTIARGLDAVGDESWAAVEAGFLSLAYPARAIAPIACRQCETVLELEVPWPRELEPGQYEPERAAPVPFPSAEAFEDHVERVAGVVFERMGVAGMTLRVEPGVPEVDAGGIPMLGSYGPEPADDGGTEFVITLYFRTFLREHEDDPTFDWKHEVEETLEHEVQHHLYYLDGHDPMDEAERNETRADAVRRAGGEARLRKLERDALLRDAWGILRILGPLLFCLFLATALFLRCS